jgi:hypothetical protein
MDDDTAFETWCDECGEFGWEGTCSACVDFDAAHPLPLPGT